MAVVLAQVGWCVSVLNKGYMRYRGEVRAALEALPPQLQLVSLTGLTGTGKTALLLHLRSKGVQVLDLEGLAKHRGSLLGAADLPPQPSQKLFESTLAAALKELDLSQPVWVEAESSKVAQGFGWRGRAARAHRTRRRCGLTLFERRSCRWAKSPCPTQCGRR
jgi:tRNA 2-selenouridine synthase